MSDTMEFKAMLKSGDYGDALCCRLAMMGKNAYENQVQQIEPGSYVLIKGLVSKPELNGTCAVAVGKSEKNIGRWNVRQLFTKKVIGIKEINLTWLVSLANLPFYTPIAGHGSSHPQPIDMRLSVMRIKAGLKASRPNKFEFYTGERICSTRAYIC